MTRKIHPLDSVRLTLNCEAGTLSLDVNGVDQGIVFSNVPPEVHPAVCFYGSAKSVRLVELKRIYSETDGDTSDSDEESDDEEGTTCNGDEKKEESPLSQRPWQQQEQQQEQQQQQPEEQLQTLPAAQFGSNNSDQIGASVSPAAEPRGIAGARSDAGSLARGSHGSLSRRKSARREQEAVSSFIRAASASSPSRGLLASLANLAQWYVPRGQEDAERVEHGATDQRSDVEEGEGDRVNRLSEAVDDSARAVSRLMPGKCAVSNRRGSYIPLCCTAARKPLVRGSLQTKPSLMSSTVWVCGCSVLSFPVLSCPSLSSHARFDRRRRGHCREWGPA